MIMWRMALEANLVLCERFFVLLYHELQRLDLLSSHPHPPTMRYTFFLHHVAQRHPMVLPWTEARKTISIPFLGSH